MAMHPPAGTTGLTYADLLELPDAGSTRFELLDGELLVTPAPLIRHQKAVLAIAAALHDHVRRHGGTALTAPTDVWFDDRTVLEPDVLAVRPDHLDRFDERRFVGPPDLVVEVSSPSTRRTDVVRKRRVYEREGVPEFWFVDLDADQVHVYRLGDDGTYGAPTVVLDDGVLEAMAFPGFTLPAADALVIPR
jgi:Uma2 family endonuclease